MARVSEDQWSRTNCATREIVKDECNSSETDEEDTDTDSDISDGWPESDSDPAEDSDCERRYYSKSWKRRKTWTNGDEDSSENSFQKVSVINIENSACDLSNFGIEEIDYFLEFMDNEVVDFIVKECNDYHDHFNDTHISCRHNPCNWRPTDRNEIYLLYGVLMLMAYIKKHEQRDYWVNDEIFGTNSIRNLLSRDRFTDLIRLFDNANKARDDEKSFQKVKPLAILLRQKFEEKVPDLYDLDGEEILRIWREDITLKKYASFQKGLFGYMIFVLCDIRTGYLLDFILWTGKQMEIILSPELGTCGSVLITLLEKCLGKKKILCIENPSLYPHLVKKGGKSSASAEENFLHPRKTVHCIRWCPRRCVYIMTNNIRGIIDTEDSVYGEGEDLKRNIIQKMKVVDSDNDMFSSIESVRQGSRWYINVFLNCLDMSIQNAHCLFLFTSAKKLPLLHFSKAVIRQLVYRYRGCTILTNVKAISPAVQNMPCFSGRHYPELIPSAESKKQLWKHCVVCAVSKKEIKTRYWCSICDKGLCIHPCFKSYHLKGF